jgi:hypothetical protein
MRHECDMRSEAAPKEDELSEQSVDGNFCQSMSCRASSCVRRCGDFLNTAISIIGQSTSSLTTKERPAFFDPGIRESGKPSSRREARTGRCS